MFSIKSISLLLALVLLSSAGCTQKKRPGGGSSPKSTAQTNNPPVAPSAPRPAPAPTPISAPATAAESEERQKVVSDLQMTLRELECDVEDDYLGCPEPKNYQHAIDLEKALQNYSKLVSSQLQSNYLKPEDRKVLEIHSKSINDYMIGVFKQMKKTHFERDFYQVHLAKEKLCMELGLKDLKPKRELFKNKNGITQNYRLMPSKNLLVYKTPTQVIKAIEEFQDTVRWFLDIYYDDSTPLHRDNRRELINELQLTSDLAERIYRIGDMRN